MKAIACEMCGSNDVIKKEGVYVCQHCGTKYTLEEARKLMVVGTVDVTGSTVKIDSSDELINLYKLARRAKDDNNSENAAKYYDMILLKDPNSWEATFYQIYFKALTCRVRDVVTATDSLKNSIATVLKLIKENMKNDDDKFASVNEVVNRCINFSDMVFNVAKNNYEKIDGRFRSEYTQEMLNSCCSAYDLSYRLGDKVSLMFAESEDIRLLACKAWENGINKHSSLLCYFVDKRINQKRINKYVQKIQKFDKTYEKPKANGCYIATCVYGSYDCPEVWVLRRFRDSVLSKNVFGRMFIRTYYALSPKIIKLFGKYGMVKSVWKYPLDLLVNKLRRNGFEDTSYTDKY